MKHFLVTEIIAEEDLYGRAGDKFNELDVGYFVKENELVNMMKRPNVFVVMSRERKRQLRILYEKEPLFNAGREREKSASYYTPEVLTKKVPC